MVLMTCRRTTPSLSTSASSAAARWSLSLSLAGLPALGYLGHLAAGTTVVCVHSGRLSNWLFPRASHFCSGSGGVVRTAGRSRTAAHDRPLTGACLRPRPRRRVTLGARGRVGPTMGQLTTGAIRGYCGHIFGRGDSRKVGAACSE